MWQRFMDAEDILRKWYSTTVVRVFGMRYYSMRDCVYEVFAAHNYLGLIFTLVLKPPYLAICWTLALADWLYDQFHETVYEIEEPRRELLTEEEIAKRAAKRRERDAVKALPLVRPRALTLLSRGGTVDFENPKVVSGKGKKRAKQSTIDQLEYCDFWRLPFEVRELIWKYTIGGNHIHIVKWRGRLGSVYCPAENPTDPIRRDLCTRMGKQGVYEKSAWPRDIRPLALLVSCRQIYSECIDLLYSHNTFAFEDPVMVPDFLNSLLHRRRRLVTSLHLNPMFMNDGELRSSASCFAYGEQSSSHVIEHLGRTLMLLTQQPALHSLTVTPKLGWKMRATGDWTLMHYVPVFTRALNELKPSSTIVLAWPENAEDYLSSYYLHSGGFWGRDGFLPEAKSRKLKIRRIPWQSPTVTIMFFIPFDVRCFHCENFTVIRRATRGYAEASFHMIDFSSPDPRFPKQYDGSMVVTRYWTFHSFCGGWIEFQHHGARKEWSVTQGAQRITMAEADRHVAEAKESYMYPDLGNPHERLAHLVVRDLVRATPLYRDHYVSWFDMRREIDEPTKEAYYRSVGWAR